MSDRIDETPKVKDWDKAKKYLDEVISQYKSLIGMPNANPWYGLLYLNTLKDRYDNFERTEELYTEMTNCE